MNPAILGVFCLLICVHSRSVRNERLNALDLSENRDLFLSALQTYFSRRGINIDRTAPSFFVLSSKPQSNRETYPNIDEFLQTKIRAHGYKKNSG